MIWWSKFSKYYVNSNQFILILTYSHIIYQYTTLYRYHISYKHIFQWKIICMFSERYWQEMKNHSRQVDMQFNNSWTCMERGAYNMLRHSNTTSSSSLFAATKVVVVFQVDDVNLSLVVWEWIELSYHPHCTYSLKLSIVFLDWNIQRFISIVF